MAARTDPLARAESALAAAALAYPEVREDHPWGEVERVPLPHRGAGSRSPSAGTRRRPAARGTAAHRPGARSVEGRSR
jgi:hypothetical protein